MKTILPFDSAVVIVGAFLLPRVHNICITVIVIIGSYVFLNSILDGFDLNFILFF